MPPKENKGTVQGVGAYFQSAESLILAKLRMIKATILRERSQKDRDDVRAVLANTRINKSKVVRGAKRETTLDLFRQLASRNSASKP